LVCSGVLRLNAAEQVYLEGGQHHLRAELAKGESGRFSLGQANTRPRYTSGLALTHVVCLTVQVRPPLRTLDTGLCKCGFCIERSHAQIAIFAKRNGDQPLQACIAKHGPPVGQGFPAEHHRVFPCNRRRWEHKLRSHRAG